MCVRPTTVIWHCSWLVSEVVVLICHIKASILYSWKTSVNTGEITCFVKRLNLKQLSLLYISFQKCCRWSRPHKRGHIDIFNYGHCSVLDLQLAFGIVHDLSGSEVVVLTDTKKHHSGKPYRWKASVSTEEITCFSAIKQLN